MKRYIVNEYNVNVVTDCKGKFDAIKIADGGYLTRMFGETTPIDERNMFNFTLQENVHNLDFSKLCNVDIVIIDKDCLDIASVWTYNSLLSESEMLGVYRVIDTVSTIIYVLK